ncbi:MAG: hypothetical protein BWY63_03697 [Chloroflexi bacterium ADurb.Bin360]|nr:MAG: hypothetical protein BWY63_03697 [Chloroflexi bacterium ADurb.Bin360]
MIKGRAEAVNIAARVGMTGLRVILLWGCIFRRSQTPHDGLRTRVIRIPQFHQAKIHQHSPTIGTNDYILRLNIAVNDSLLMAILKSIKQLLSPGEHPGFSKCSFALNDAIQALPLDKIHHEVGVWSFKEKIRHADQIRMAKPRQNGCFLVKLLAQTL